MFLYLRVYNVYCVIRHEIYCSFASLSLHIVLYHNLLPTACLHESYYTLLCALQAGKKKSPLHYIIVKIVVVAKYQSLPSRQFFLKIILFILLIGSFCVGELFPQ